MESSVKAAMLKSSHVLGPTTPTATATAPAPARGLRRVQSGSSLNIESSPHRDKGAAAVPDQHHHHARAATPAGATAPGAHVGGPNGTAAHSRGVSVDGVPSPQRPRSRSGFAASAAAAAPRGKVLSPVQFVSLLTGKSSLELEVDVVKKLRLLLRNEAAR
jgi:hypothetical protein